MMKAALFTLALAGALPVAGAGLAQSGADRAAWPGHGLVKPISFGRAPDAATRFGFVPTARVGPRPEYFVSDNVAIEMIGAWPFDLGSAPARRASAAANLPPVVSLQYHFRIDDQTTSFLGAGLNNAPLLDGGLEGLPTIGDLDRGWGTALRMGVDFAVSRNGALRTDVSWFDVDETDRRLDAAFGSTDFDPWAFGISYVLKF